MLGCFEMPAQRRRDGARDDFGQRCVGQLAVGITAGLRQLHS
jgi:hypothetical protein